MHKIINEILKFLDCPVQLKSPCGIRLLYRKIIIDRLLNGCEGLLDDIKQLLGIISKRIKVEIYF